MTIFRICQQCHQSFPVPSTVSARMLPTVKYCSHACYSASIKARPLHEVIARFWARVTVCPHAPYCLFCHWLWTGNSDKMGYGKISVNSHRVFVHRFSWALHNAPARIPDDYGPIIRHLCHTPSCVNPAHLASGPHALNRADSVMAGRDSHAKLLPAEVQRIRGMHQDGMSYEAIASFFPVEASTIKSICLFRHWKHLRQPLS